jgi:hypothetical protein
VDAKELAGILGHGKETRNGDGSWNTLCPGHNDINSPSLTITDGPGGKLLVRCHAKCSQDQIISALVSRGLWKTKKRQWTPVYPVPDHVKLPLTVEHWKFGKPSHMWAYHRRDGKLVGYICRFNLANGKKELWPYTYCQSDDGERGWWWKSFAKPRPLYNEHLLDQYPDRPVLLVEGEKTADAAQALLGDAYIVMTWPGGSKAVAYSRFEVLKGRDVTLWPDADEPGVVTVTKIAEILAELETPCKIVFLPEGLPEGWDLADPAPEGLTIDVRQLINQARSFEPSGDVIIDKFNREFALVLLGDKAVVLHEDPNPLTGITEIKHISLAGFTRYYGNTFAMQGRREVPAPNYWLDHPLRRSYKGVVFEPLRETPGYYNLWKGYSVEPDPTGDWSMFREHLLENVAGGDESLLNWVLGWFAQIMQQPHKKPGTSISCRGEQGTGKTIIGEHFGHLIHRHYVYVDDARYVVGNFNSHMGSALILHSDEAFWAGDPRHTGRLKGIVTSKTNRIEPKGKDSFEVNNYMRLLVTSNSEWVVPAAFEERRFAVFDIGNGRRQDKPYFKAMSRQLKSGGYGALLHDLLNFDLSTVDVGVIPSTRGLKQQKQNSFDSVARFWHERLIDGDLVPGQGNGWARWIPCEEFYMAYINRCQAWGVHRRESQNQFVSELKKFLPQRELSRSRRVVKRGNVDFEDSTRCWGYEFPSLEICRQRFDDLIGGEPTNWDAPDVPLPDEEIPF